MILTINLYKIAVYLEKSFIEVKPCFKGANRSVQMRTVVFQVLYDILGDGLEYVQKFAPIITNKWLLLFFENDSDSLSVILAAKILSKLFFVQGPSYIQKFRSSDGFLVLNKLLPAHWNMIHLHEIIFLTALGIDATEYSLQEDFDIKNVRRCLENNKPLGFNAVVPELIPIIFAMWNEHEKNSIRNSANTKAAHITNTFLQLFSELYHSSYLLKEAYSKQDTVDNVIQVLFSSLCVPSLIITAEGELESKDSVLSNFGSSIQQSSTARVDTSTDRLSSKSMDEGTKLIESKPIIENNILMRGGLSALTTRTSPHTVRETNTPLCSLGYTTLFFV